MPGESAVRVCIVGTADGVVETIEAAGHTVFTETPTTIARRDPAIIVTVGEESLLTVARERPATPILPVDTEIGPAAGEHAMIVAALDDGTEQTQPVLGVSIDGEPVATALMDVMLVTSEPARISEYAIDHDDERVAAFRADGVVVATPAGSRGYTATAGGPTISPRTDALCVVPVAPFHTQSANWVVDTTPLALSVLRDEGAVSLLIDDAEYGSLGSGQRVGLAVDGCVRTRHP